ncbi:MAG: hypothetical protein M1370_02210 [Bacteroidetes bacterium]|nr:hypothetical protein [Bacteroidota bacterium]
MLDGAVVPTVVGVLVSTATDVAVGVLVGGTLTSFGVGVRVAVQLSMTARNTVLAHMP